MTINKLSSTAGKLNVFFKVLQRIILIAAIVMIIVLAVLTVANWVDPTTVIGTDLNTVDIGSITIELAEENTPNNGEILRYAWIYGILGLVSAIVIWIGLGYIRKILSPMTEGSPFHPDTSRYLKKLANLSLVLGIAQNVGNFLESATALRSFGLDKLAESDMIRSVTVNYTLDLGFLILFFLLLLMSYIFSYGAELQKLSDETL